MQVMTDTCWMDASLPVRGAWIEILLLPAMPPISRSLPVRGAWIEIYILTFVVHAQKSLPVRGAWIEIERCAMVLRYSAVAPRAGSVD